MALWTAAEAADATGGQSAGDWVAHGVSIDTRTLAEGDLFVALKAARDGHEFVAAALNKGAAAAVVTHRPEGVPEDAPLLIVPDVLAALEALGTAARTHTKARVLAITGSVGKTSAKEMARTVLARQGRTHAAEASYNNHWGVPLTLARMPKGTEFAVIEIGMSNPGEIAPLSRLARPHVALITTIAAAHLEAFDDISGIAREKAAIFDGLTANGVAVINADVDTSEVLQHCASKKEARQVLFGQMSRDWKLSHVTLSEGQTMVQADTPRGALMFKLSTAGRHFAMNGLGILAACEAMGADPVQAAMDLSHWAPPTGRGTREVVTLDAAHEDETLILLDDAFNANPTSLSAALEVLASYTPTDHVGRIVKGRRVAVLGDMLELGPDEIEMHAEMAKDASMQALHLIHCAGPRMRALYDALPDARRGVWVERAEDLATQASDLVDAGDVVLVKGSKSSRISLVVDAIRKLGHPAAGPQG
ncbi:UDP-N-acetylmuramoyl-tripeptide--D-alanyl-D-alanine ligase [Thalassorhabdomicrobium marinisediminis]|uniref:UDP-N-acetylmuramoyl-tripeptide--D-alanyl-D-alanine ligase n=1 Tax=Thalassorhabdomicrobium marinisediminis TaxID=2170577 RepID=A0A2T7FXZ5_9RHOB|nr:UDP-N-acetylmuramoyl-tripeptide--D-alanyl-D-alanine ligase [Thalassorhabdomicrobium marinisediminis]PVA07008.1 UDP-N-acetylmuramoyl-tripeptide--D-alanyl-D-alanine ligase [Thalassorhabdomicrobium marinisediminis]